MAVDPRQVLAGVLTVTMFVMLGDMIKRDHFDDPHPTVHDTNKASEHTLASVAKGADGPWKEDGIADAVVVARQLRATLVIPDIRGSEPGDRRNFDEVYDVDKFVSSLDGVVKVMKSQPRISARNLAVVKVPNRVTEGFIADNIETVFRTKGNIRLPQTEVREVVDSMIDRLKTLSRKSNGQFVAIDLRIDILEKKGCHKNGGSGSKSCYAPQDIALFLKKLGFEKDTTVYVTQTKWHSSLDALKDFFPKTYTKESIMPMENKDKFLNSDTTEFEKVIDYYICSESDVFVPAISGLFYANVAGKRIASGKTQILVPEDIPSSTAAPEEFISSY
ncbi:hypothetical protein C2S51_011704 [Perilla frutescens var. frutescens]|nr:hypothetical protein C2S51_011704 [Perilla frutescens var. frutescens]